MSENLSPRRSTEPGEFYILPGVGPHPDPWPIGDEYDPALLAGGDDRNVQDEFRYLTIDAIAQRLHQRRIPLEIAIENWQHDLNIGALVRTANGFNVTAFHIVGAKHWNPGGAVGTYKYIDIQHHATVETFAEQCRQKSLPIIGLEHTATSQPIESAIFPARCVLLFGNEGLGLTEPAIAACTSIYEIAQAGSVRSLNASAAGAIAMYAWRQQHRAD